jgi:flagellar M-ring protein FliF
VCSSDLAVGIAVLIAILAGMWMWGQTPEYRVLYSNLSDRDGGAIIDSLQQMNIPYKFTEGGGALMVPANMVHDARLKLAAQGLPKGGNVGFELMENQRFGITQFAEQVNYQRALEGELARSVQSIGGVAAARVHLAIPKPSVFVKEQQKPSASVVLTLQGGRLLDTAQVSAIVHLISSSVPNLSAKDVTVVDQNGTLLSAHDSTDGQGMDASQIKYVQQLEHSYIERINSLLIPMFGADNVRTQVSANVDFARTEQTSEIYKPNQSPTDQTIRSQQSSEASNSSAQNGGVPGALTNQPPVPATAPLVAPPGTGAAAGPAGQTNSQRTATVNFEVDRTISHTVLPVGSIKRLSVAVVVNGNRIVTDAAGKSSSRPLGDTEKEQITHLVRDAMGFDEKRGDSLNVELATFAGSKEIAAELPLWRQPWVIDLSKDAIKYLLIAAVLLYVLFGIVRPALRPLTHPVDNESDSTIHDLEGAQAQEAPAPYVPIPPPYEQSLQSARMIAQQDPKIAASVIKDWVNE